MIGRAADPSTGVRRPALEQLLRRYIGPLRHHLVRRRRLPIERAEDLLQGFVSSKVLEQNLLAKAEPGRGQFRGFLLRSLDRFVSDRLRQEAQRRRAAGEVVALEEQAEPIDDAATPDQAFDLEWARQVLGDAAGRMRRQCARSGRADVWAVFEARVLLPTLTGAEPVPNEKLARDLGFGSAADVSNRLVTAKRMFARLLREVVGEYASGGEEVEEELADLRLSLARGGGHGLRTLHIGQKSEGRPER